MGDKNRASARKSSQEPLCHSCDEPGRTLKRKEGTVVCPRVKARSRAIPYGRDDCGLYITAAARPAETPA